MNTSSLSSCIARWCSGGFAVVSAITIISCRVLAAMNCLKSACLAHLLPCHSNADSIFRRDEVIQALGRIAYSELHPLDRSGERIAARAVVRRHWGAAVLADVAAVVGGEDHRLRHRDGSVADLLAVDIERHLAALAEAAAGVGKLHAYLVLARRQRTRGFNVEVIYSRHVIAVFELAVLRVEA